MTFRTMVVITDTCSLEFGKFSCDNGTKCLLIREVCDKVHDCADGSDEHSRCSTLSREFMLSVPEVVVTRQWDDSFKSRNTCLFIFRPRSGSSRVAFRNFISRMRPINQHYHCSSSPREFPLCGSVVEQHPEKNYLGNHWGQKEGSYAADRVDLRLCVSRWDVLPLTMMTITLSWCLFWCYLNRTIPL